jgi:tape measure domain-containing protein
VLAGFAACATVIQKLAQASLDGKLTMEEINSAFGAKPSK